MHGPVWTVLPEDGVAQGESSALLCTTCGVACVVVDARGNLFSRRWERLRGAVACVACPAPALDKCESVPRCCFLLPPGAPECTTVYSWNQNHHLFAQNIGQDGVSAGITNRAVLDCTNHAALPSYSQLTSEKLGAK